MKRNAQPKSLFIVKTSTGQPNLNLNVLSSDTCETHTGNCNDPECRAIKAYKSFLSSISSANLINHIALVRVDALTDEGLDVSNVRCLVCVKYSQSDLILNITLVGVDQPGISYSFIFNSDQYNVLKQKHGLNVDMAEFVNYFYSILQINEPNASSDVWYSLRLTSANGTVKLHITENRKSRYLSFLCVEGNDSVPQADVLALESLHRWNFAQALIVSLDKHRQALDRELCDMRNTVAVTLGDLDRSRKDSESLRSELSHAMETLEKLQQLHTKDQTAVHELMLAKQTANQELEMVNQKLAKENVAFTNLQDKFNRQVSEMEIRAAEIARLENLINENELRFAKSNELQAQVSSLAIENQSLKEVNEKLLAKQAETTALLGSSRSELLDLRQELVQMREKLKTLEISNTEHITARQQLEAQLAKVSVKANGYDALMEERNSLRANCEELKNEMRKLNLHVAKRLLAGGCVVNRPQSHPYSSHIPVDDEDEEEEDEQEGYDENSGYIDMAALPVPPTSLAEKKSWLRNLQRDTPPPARRRRSDLASLYTR